ncbi:protein of unknown function [Candidatus Hydrogenisulfobacillus filiaventi]|uniref:Uncharacterized protein n=1 Tax=Candidatus Hydrogenisulfobacillus filiaventi TaxID=2707344 RepID=A0A6F8ZFZ2_9FIRM|nr:protein of unknown function [Candidatus Hydrogenisulfobacillus filiaventi]
MGGQRGRRPGRPSAGFLAGPGAGGGGLGLGRRPEPAHAGGGPPDLGGVHLGTEGEAVPEGGPGVGIGECGPVLPASWRALLEAIGTGGALLGLGAAWGYGRGLRHGRQQGRAQAPLDLRRHLLQEGRCPLCGAAAAPGPRHPENESAGPVPPAVHPKAPPPPAEPPAGR